MRHCHAYRLTRYMRWMLEAMFHNSGYCILQQLVITDHNSMLSIKNNWSLNEIRKILCFENINIHVLDNVTGLINSGYSWQQMELWISSNLKQHRENINQNDFQSTILPRFHKVTKDNEHTHWSMIRSRIIDLMTHHIRKHTSCIFHLHVHRTPSK